MYGITSGREGAYKRSVNYRKEYIRGRHMSNSLVYYQAWWEIAAEDVSASDRPRPFGVSTD